MGLIYAVNRRRTQRVNSIIDTERLVAELAGMAGLQYHPEWLLVHDGDWSETTGYELLHNFWQLDNHPEAVIVTDDILCNGVLRAVLQLGVSLPDELSLITLANHGGSLAYHEPITRVEFDSDQMAKQAVVMMDNLLYKRPLTQQQILLKGHLIAGEST